MFGRPRQGPSAEERQIGIGPRCSITEAQRNGTDVIFHGACIGCLYKQGNATGENLRWCLGCAYSDFSDAKPNRRLREADQRDLDAYEAGYY